jgi:putative peptidoglycan lipid II flippase
MLTEAKQLWTSLTRGSTNRRILGASLTILAMTVAVKGVTFVKEVMVAARFGTADELDAFLIAFLIPSFVINVLGMSLGAVFIPVYVEIREAHGAAHADRLLAKTVGWMCVLLTAAMLVVTVIAPWYLPVVASGFTDDKRRLVQDLLWWLIPFVALSGVRALWGAALNADERFGLMSLVPVQTPLMLIALLALFPSLGVYGLVVGFILGTLLETMTLGVALSRLGVRLRPDWSQYDDSLRQLARQWLPMTAGAVLMAAGAVVDQTMAAMLAPGSVAALEYGNRMVGAVMGLGTTTLGVAVVPYFSQLAARRDWSTLAHVVRRWLLLVVAITLPVVLLLVVFAEPIVRIGLERGAFSAADTQLVARIQVLLALQIPFYVAGIVLVRLVSALQAAPVLAWICLSTVTLKILLNIVLINELGLPGIALSTSLMYVASSALLLWYVARRWRQTI